MKRDDASLDKLIAAKRLDPLMSNAKWVKLLNTIVDNVGLITECRLKLLWEEENAERQLIFDQYTSYNFDYYDSAMEAMISGVPRGWYAYKEIEWLDFPRHNSAKGVVQNVEAIKKKIEEIGQFLLESSNDNLRLYAYQRPYI